MSFYREQLENYLKTLDIKADRVLDIGGKELPIKNRVKSWNVESYDIIDLPDRDLNTDWNLKPKIKEGDIVFCLETMEYVFNPIQAIQNIYSVLKKNGKLFITFQFVYPYHNPKEIDYLRYTRSGVLKFLEGFRIEKIVERIDRSGKLAEFYNADGMHCAGDSNITGFIVEATK